MQRSSEPITLHQLPGNQFEISTSLAINSNYDMQRPQQESPKDMLIIVWTLGFFKGKSMRGLW